MRNRIICGRVVRKQNRTSYVRNDGREGRFFLVDLVDEYGEIRIIGYDGECDRYHGYPWNGDFLKVRLGKVVFKDAALNKLRHDCEIHIVAETELYRVLDEKFWNELDDNLPYFHTSAAMTLGDIRLLDENTFVGEKTPLIPSTIASLCGRILFRILFDATNFLFIY